MSLSRRCIDAARPTSAHTSEVCEVKPGRESYVCVVVVTVNDFLASVACSVTFD